MKFPIDRIPSCPILKFENRLKIVILEICYNHYEISER
jgi:hypothetical protein